MRLPATFLFALFSMIAIPSCANENDTTGASKMITVLITTNQGDITLELDSEKAPDSVANFVQYANDGHYNGTIFHRVIPGFMVQGGGFTPDMKQKETRAPVNNEANNGLKNIKGSVAMARTNAPHSATSQFFINLKDNGFLDYPGQDGWGYCVFGKVTDGLDVITAIEKVKTGNRNGMGDVPLEDVVIETVVIQ